MKMFKKLAVAALVAGTVISVAFAAEQLIKPGAASTLAITNATYNGTEGGAFHRTFKGTYVWRNDDGVTTTNPPAGWTLATVTNRAIEFVTRFGTWETNAWTPHTTSTNIYYLAVDWQASFAPLATCDMWSCGIGMAQYSNNFITTNFGRFAGRNLFNGQYSATPSFNAGSFSMSEILKMHGDEWLRFIIWDISTNISFNASSVGITVVGEE